MTRNRLIFASILLGAVAWPAPAASRHYAISSEQVAATVGRMGVQIIPGQVALLTNVVAATPVPSLQVRSVERFDAGRFVVRLECANGDDCVPFMASVQVSEIGATQLADVATRMSMLRNSYSNTANQTRPKEIVVRNGSPAILQLEGAHVQIRIPVICLESGSAGQTIRAADKDHRRVYSAQVVENGLLRGRL